MPPFAFIRYMKLSFKNWATLNVSCAAKQQSPKKKAAHASGQCILKGKCGTALSVNIMAGKHRSVRVLSTPPCVFVPCARHSSCKEGVREPQDSSLGSASVVGEPHLAMP